MRRSFFGSSLGAMARHPRAATLAALRRAVAAGADPARIVAGAKVYAASVAGRERRFVISAVRWISEGRWPRAAPAPTRTRRASRRYGFPRPRPHGRATPIAIAPPRARARPSTPKAAGDFRRKVTPRRSNTRHSLPKQKRKTHMKTQSISRRALAAGLALAPARASRNRPRESANAPTHSRRARGA